MIHINQFRRKGQGCGGKGETNTLMYMNSLVKLWPAQKHLFLCTFLVHVCIST